MMKAYPKYKNSGVEWVGQIPIGWNVVPLYKVCSESKVSNKGMIEENLVSLSYGKIIKKDIQALGGMLPDSFETYQIVNKNNIVFRGMDLQNDKRSLRSAICSERGIITSAYIALIPENITPEYLSYIMRAYDYTKVFYNLGSGMRQSLRYEELKRLPLILPPRELQLKIVSFIDDKTSRIDNLISEKQNFIKLLQEKRGALISHVVTKGLNSNVKMKDSGVEWIGDIPESWSLKRFRHLFSLGKGLTITKENLRDSGIPCVNYGEIHSKYNFELDLNKHSLKYVEEDYLLSNSSSLIKKGDFVFADTSEDFEGCGNFTHLVSDDPIFAGYHTVIARLTNECDSRYMSYLLDSKIHRDQIRRSVKGVKVFSITQRILKDTVLFFPNKKEQIETVKYLDYKIELMKEMEKETKNSISLLKEHRTALISAAVTGKIDLREAV